MIESDNLLQNVIIEGRKRLNVSGVKEVCAFDDETIVVDTVLGRMTIKGENMHIENFNSEAGDLAVSGKFHAAVYMSDAQNGGFFSRLFR